jgi:Tfp pilus assembly protein PilW
MRLISVNQVTLSRRSGMTLAEIMVTTLIASLVLTIIATLTIFATRSVLAMTNYTELDQDSRNTLDILTRDIRQASGLVSFAANRIVIRFPDSNTCTYVYNQNLGTLVRSNSSGSKILLEGCDQLTFQVSQRNPSNDFYFYQATIATAKLIDVSWKCSREIKAQKVNTESIQTAKIVMRN